MSLNSGISRTQFHGLLSSWGQHCSVDCFAHQLIGPKIVLLLWSGSYRDCFAQLASSHLSQLRNICCEWFVCFPHKEDACHIPVSSFTGHGLHGVVDEFWKCWYTHKSARASSILELHAHIAKICAVDNELHNLCKTWTNDRTN